MSTRRASVAAILLTFALVACGDQSTPDPDTTAATAETTGTTVSTDSLTNDSTVPGSTPLRLPIGLTTVDQVDALVAAYDGVVHVTDDGQGNRGRFTFTVYDTSLKVTGDLTLDGKSRYTVWLVDKEAYVLMEDDADVDIPDYFRRYSGTVYRSDQDATDGLARLIPLDFIGMVRTGLPAPDAQDVTFITTETGYRIQWVVEQKTQPEFDAQGLPLLDTIKTVKETLTTDLHVDADRVFTGWETRVGTGPDAVRAQGTRVFYGDRYRFEAPTRYETVQRMTFYAIVTRDGSVIGPSGTTGMALAAAAGAAQTYHRENGSFSGMDAAALARATKAPEFSDSPVTETDVAMVHVVDADHARIAMLSPDGQCFFSVVTVTDSLVDSAVTTEPAPVIDGKQTCDARP